MKSIIVSAIAIASLLGFSTVSASAGELLRSGLNPTELGIVPTIAGVPAGTFEWVLKKGEVELKSSGRLKLKVRKLLISQSVQEDCEEGTTCGFDVYASLVCGTEVVASTETVTLHEDGDAKIKVKDFLNGKNAESATISDCEGAIVLLRVDLGGASNDPWIAVTGFDI